MRTINENMAEMLGTVRNCPPAQICSKSKPLGINDPAGLNKQAFASTVSRFPPYLVVAGSFLAHSQLIFTEALP